MNKQTISVLANVEVSGPNGSITTTFTVGWADVKDDNGERIGSVDAKIDGSVEIHVYEGSEQWMFRIRAPELWRIANEAKRMVGDRSGGQYHDKK
jgi:hypothetical protein